MSVLMLLDWGQTPYEAYERVNAIIGIRGDADAPDGLVEHVACADGDRVVICDVWDSEEALGRFARDRLGPAGEEAGIPQAQPRILPVHDRLRGRGSDARVLLLAELPGVTPDDYDELVRHMDAHTHGDHPAVMHTAAVGEGGTMVVADLWDSPESFEAFAAEQIAPAGKRIGLGPLTPRFLPVKNRIRGRVPSAH